MHRKSAIERNDPSGGRRWGHTWPDARAGDVASSSYYLKSGLLLSQRQCRPQGFHHFAEHRGRQRADHFIHV